MIGWGEGLDQVTDYLNAQIGADRFVVASNYVNVVRHRFDGTTFSLTRLPTDLAPSVDYVVLYVNTVQRVQFSKFTRQAINAGPPVFTARVHGLDVAWVFRVPRGVQVTPSPNVSDNSDDFDDDR